MNRATPRMRKIAKTLLAYETFGESPHTGALAAFRVSEKLRPHLANLMGVGGFHALLSRALALASAEVAWLGGVRVDANGTLAGLEDTHLQLAQAEVLEGPIVLLAHLFGLLEALIGLILTLRQVQEVWPELNPTIWVVAEQEAQSADAPQRG